MYGRHSSNYVSNEQNWISSGHKMVNNTSIEIEEASVPFMMKCDEISRMIAGNSVLKSLHLPYICSFCDHYFEKVVPREMITMSDSQLNIPTPNCSECGNLATIHSAKGEFVYLLIDGL